MEKVVVQTGAKTYQIADQDGNDLGVFQIYSFRCWYFKEV